MLLQILLLALSCGAHVHGEGSIKIAQEGKDLEVEMELPAADLLGFEHKPKNEEQHAKVKDVMEKLKDSHLFITFNADAACKLVKWDLKKEMADKEHMDLEIEYDFICENPESIHLIEFKGFAVYPKLSKMKVQAILNDKPISETLTRSQDFIQWAK